MKRRKRKPYVWHFLAVWERDSWNGISYDGVERYTSDVPLQRIAFTVDKPRPVACSMRFSPRRVDMIMRRAFRRYKPPLRRKYLAML